MRWWGRFAVRPTRGRGFAVVASEVRSLAGRSAQAAKEIKILIAASVEKVEGGQQVVAVFKLGNESGLLALR